jgi:hypothetical protein
MQSASIMQAGTTQSEWWQRVTSRLMIDALA